MEIKRIKIKSITRNEIPKKVYDIEVEKNNNFFANNILVHNCIFQEQLSEIAHKLGKDISLDEGQLLRKVLTKKGTGKEEEVKNRLYQKFIDGCLEKKIKLSDAEELWQKMIFFSKYSFNRSHSISYSIISYTCAYLLNYYPAEWSSAYLDAESEDKKEKAINLVKSLNFTISPCDINKSTANWEIDPNDDKTLVQPFTSLKGLGDKAMEQIINNRPFNTIEELLFNENISYQKLNKKSLDVLVKSESLKSIMDNRFEHTKHMWCSIVFNRPKTEKQLLENIEEYRGQPDFSEEQKIEHATTLSGIFPFDMVMSEKLLRRLEEMCIPPISEYDPELCDCVWAIPRNVIQKKTGKGKDYYVVDLIDSNSKQTSIRCWGIDINKDTIYVNRPYMIKPDWSPQWSFSTRGAIKRTWKLLG